MKEKVAGLQSRLDVSNKIISSLNEKIDGGDEKEEEEDAKLNIPKQLQDQKGI